MTVTNDGFLHFGDAVMLVHTGRGKNDYLALNINADINNLITSPTPGIKAPCGVSAGRAQACIRTTFIITRYARKNTWAPVHKHGNTAGGL